MTHNILVILAHPDDESFICGGTLARYAALGHTVTLVCATRGEMGRRLGIPPIANRETLPVLRESELRAACAALGIRDLRFLGLRDKTLDYYNPAELAGLLLPVIRELKPSVLITFHEQVSGHADHNAIGRAATLAWKNAGQPGRLYYVLWSDYKAQLAKLGAGEYRVTSIVVDGPSARAKVNAYRAHRTQSAPMEWLRDEAEAVRTLTGSEHFLQGSGPSRPGETNLLP